MAFCKFSSEFIASQYTSIDNSFINGFMLDAPEGSVKVYLLGLFSCNHPENNDNSLKRFATILNISQEDVLSYFTYWEEMGLVQVLNTEPIEVRYLPIKEFSNAYKKFNVSKYKEFNVQVQDLIKGRMITPNEYKEYYYIIESLHVEKDAMIMIIKYCTSLKGDNVGYSYIITIAKNWAYDGIKTCEDVENRLLELEKSSGDVLCVLKLLGLKRKATNEEYQMFLKWRKEYLLDIDIILYLAKQSKKVNGGFLKLNYLIEKCYLLKLDSIKEIQDYFNNLETMTNLAKNVTRSLGLRYDNIEIVVDTYINRWINLGFDENTIEKISLMAFKNNVRNLNGLDYVFNNLFKKGIITGEAIDNYIENETKNDGIIKEILIKLGLDRNVNNADRTLYKTWVYSWNISKELLDYACELSIDKYLPMQYLNKTLSIYHNQNINSVDKAKKCKLDNSTNINAKTVVKREYSSNEIDALFNSVYEVEL